MKLRTLESLIPFPEPSPDPLVIQLAEENAHMLKRMEDISQIAYITASLANSRSKQKTLASIAAQELRRGID